MRWFGQREVSDPQPDLKDALEAIVRRCESLENAFQTMKLDWEIVTAHVDQQTNKVHRELGHVTKRRADLERAEGNPESESLPLRRSRFSGGRAR